jgi:hypothetical protein
MSQTRGRAGTAVVFLVMTISMTVWHPYPYDNVVTRWALTARFVDAGTLSIDPWAFMTADRALWMGHYYCDKAVMSSAAACAVYAPMSLLGLRSAPPGQLPVGGAARFLAERITVGGFFLLLLLCLRRKLLEEGTDPGIPLLALGAGSILLPYSTMLYAHVQAACLLFLSWFFQERKRHLLADVCGAAAVSFEFPVLVLWAIILCYRGRGYWRPVTAARTAGILALFLLPQLAHNWIAFGSPITMGYSLESEQYFSGIREGLFGFTVPSLRTFYMIALSPERGLYFYMPWAVPALAGLWGRGGIRQALRSGPGIPLTAAWILLFSAQYARTSGWAFGPRYLIPMVPFLAWGLGRFASRSPRHAFTSLVLLLPAILTCLLGTFGEPHQPVHPFERPLPLPQLSIGLRMMLDGHHAVWILGTAGALAASLALVAVWAAGFRGTKPCFPAAAVLVPWLVLGFLSSRADWGGKIDYYRGLLAQHRHEYDLAASYYLDALEDPTAPAAVRENYECCRSMAGPDTRED